MITYSEAQNILSTQAHSFGKETIFLVEAPDRILGEKIFSDRDYPPFNRSAMDGFAVRFADLEKGIRDFEIIETIYAGQAHTKLLSNGQCYRIMTGAGLPEGADLTIRREDTDERANNICLKDGHFHSFQNVSRKGEDCRSGALIIDQPVQCNPAIISLLATLGKNRVVVERLPDVAIITTGNEVVDGEEIISPLHIRNSNQAMLIALLRKYSMKPVTVQHVKDDASLLREAFSSALEADIVISCGGVSAGDADYVPGVLAELCVEKLFHKVAIKPGKPIWSGKTKNGIVFALPGNPFSCLVTFILFVQHYINACNGLPVLKPERYLLKGERQKKSSFDEFYPVKIINNQHQVQPLPFNGSGDIQAVLFADGIALHVAGKTRVEDELVDFFYLK